MSHVPEVFSFMLDAWNERDLDKIRLHVDRCISDKVVFADPTNFVHGIDEFTEMIVRYRQKYPESVIKRTSGMDSHNNRYRYSWEIYIGNMTLIKGFDFVQLDENGLVDRVDGFFGDLPALEH